MSGLKGTPRTVGDLRRRIDAITRPIRKRGAAAKEEAKWLIEEIPQMDIANADEYLREHPPTALAIVVLIRMAADRARSQSAREAAGSKNSEAREWMRGEWKRDGHKYPSRKQFVIRKHPEIERLFGIRVTADRIYRYWLKSE